MATDEKAPPRRRSRKPQRAADALADEKPDVLVDYYRMMWLMRRFEERTGEMYQRAKIGGYCHLNLGEEATVVGLLAALEPRDYLFTNYREHGYALAKGIEPGRVMAELFGRQTGVSHGRGGSMHLFDASARLLGGYAIVGGQIPLATGAAQAIAYRGSDEVVMCQMGDGTTNTGAFHECLNLAQLWKLPIVYVIVNNLLGMGTTVEAASAEPELYQRACAYRMASERVDGNDLLAVRDAARRAVDRARTESLPTLLEATSFRMRGHSVVDPARYRANEEVERGRARDPVPAFRARLVAAGVLDETGAAELEAEVEREVAQAIDFADQSPDPSVEDLFADAYATPVANEPRGLPGDPVVASAPHSVEVM
ncbi:MAG TPA: pyruvate dehydrogenase (acetyl-transferring) E1 component subunit alpha [Actinomycetes bacterium]|jgi:pyruvate dehydrogenase E1 component alpha subunit|nr:pyruvate dehydrogenase (acetyl-transferring) E1 component subunit alpha [Actinomycetes bacterium]